MTDPTRKPLKPLRPIDILLKIRQSPRDPKRGEVTCASSPGTPTTEHYMMCLNAIIDAICLENGCTREEVIAQLSTDEQGHFEDHLKFHGGSQA